MKDYEGILMNMFMFEYIVYVIYIIEFTHMC